MAELPELTILVSQMHSSLAGATIARVEALQPKCLNVAPSTLAAGLTGRSVQGVRSIGKWIAIDLADGSHLLLNLGMGADVRHFGAESDRPAKYQFSITTRRGDGFTVRFWWFGRIQLVPKGGLCRHPQVKDIAPLALDPVITLDWFRAMLREAGGKAIKQVLMDQRRIAGIGNAYMHDILWEGQVHPATKACELTAERTALLYEGMRRVLKNATSLGGWEQDFYGRGGNIATPDRLTTIGYRAGKPCPRCGSVIEKIRTGGTATFICPGCQVL